MGVSTNIMNFLSNGEYSKRIMEFIPQVQAPQISDERIAHMHGVAELMWQYSHAFSCTVLSRNELYFLGLIHDIGYIDGKEGHEDYGSELLSMLLEFGNKNMIARCVKWHGVTPREYVDIHQCYASDIPGELILLWWADMMVEAGGDKAGEVVGFQGRLDGLKDRYGEDSKPYQTCKETMEWLINNMALDFLSK